MMMDVNPYQNKAKKNTKHSKSRDLVRSQLFRILNITEMANVTSLFNTQKLT